MADRPPPPPPALPSPLPSSFDGNEDFYNERPLQKLVRKVKEEPLVPLGICLTVFAFMNAARALRRGDSRQANRMFRARVAAQGFTVCAMVGGSVYFKQDREKTKELRELKAQRDAEEKHQKWIHELEARDKEEKALQARREKRRLDKMDRDPARPEPDPARPATGAVLGNMGLWAQGQSKAEQAAPTAVAVAAAAEDKKATDKTPKAANPKSSLGAIGELIAASKSKGGGDSPASEEKEEKEEPRK